VLIQSDSVVCVLQTEKQL